MLRHSTPDFFPRFTLLLGTSYYKKVHMRGREKSSIIWMHLSVHSASLKVIQQRWKNAHKHHMENKWGIRLNKILARNEKDWIHCYHAFLCESPDQIRTAWVYYSVCFWPCTNMQTNNQKSNSRCHIPYVMKWFDALDCLYRKTLLHVLAITRANDFSWRNVNECCLQKLRQAEIPADYAFTTTLAWNSSTWERRSSAGQ